LHVGCGANHKGSTTPGFQAAKWKELRLDINPAVKPDIIGSMTDMGEVADESVDAVFSSHNIEHLYAHEVPIALSEFYRVLRPDGFTVITCPDLQSVCKLVADGKLTEPAYVSPAGPIAPLDILYGLRSAVAEGNHFMAHRCGFTRDSLIAEVKAAGFSSTLGLMRPKAFDLWVLGTKQRMEKESLLEQAKQYFR
jgi:SAM-dependent methyltransferase